MERHFARPKTAKRPRDETLCVSVSKKLPDTRITLLISFMYNFVVSEKEE